MMSVCFSPSVFPLLFSPFSEIKTAQKWQKKKNVLLVVTACFRRPLDVAEAGVQDAIITYSKLGLEKYVQDHKPGMIVLS